jgi:hypothetical protein
MFTIVLGGEFRFQYEDFHLAQKFFEDAAMPNMGSPSALVAFYGVDGELIAEKAAGEMWLRILKPVYFVRGPEASQLLLAYAQ